MPNILNLQTSLVRYANAAFARTFFPRFRKQSWPSIARPFVSTASVEPFAFLGAAPLLTKFNGTMRSRGINSWNLNSPNLLYKNFEDLSRGDIEKDQTGTFLQRVGWHGVRAAQAPDYLLCKKIITGHLTSSATVTFEGQTYNTTLEPDIPYFSNAHNTWTGGTQTNVLVGSCLSTKAAFAANNVGLNAQAMTADIAALIDLIAGVKDDTGAQIWPDFDPAENLVLWVPPIMRAAARLAFQTGGAILGGSPGNSGTTGSTTAIGATLVKDVKSPGLLASLTDPDDQNQGPLTPDYDTAYYAFVVYDMVPPFFYQRFRPLKQSEIINTTEYNPAAESDRIMEKMSELGKPVSRESADVYASTIIDHNLNAIGANATRDVVEQEKFFISTRAQHAFQSI